MKFNSFSLPKLLIISMMAVSCSDYQSYYGETQGTTFQVKFRSPEGLAFEMEIDSILQLVDDEFSTYKTTSVISQFNASQSGIKVDSLFRDLWEKCWELNIESDGFFDPTLSAVFDVYKNMDKDNLDSALILQTLKHTGMPLVTSRGDSLLKNDESVKLNFNAIAQGYSVDLICDFLESMDVQNYMVEIGGEVRSKGFNDKREKWRIGIERPTVERSGLMARLALSGQSCATSGNYRNFSEIEGKRIGHILNPKTGFPESSSILSVSVVADRCFRADALATALMNRSADEIREFDNSTSDVRVIYIQLVQSDTVLYISPDLEEQVD